MCRTWLSIILCRCVAQINELHFVPLQRGEYFLQMWWRHLFHRFLLMVRNCETSGTFKFVAGRRAWFSWRNQLSYCCYGLTVVALVFFYVATFQFFWSAQGWSLFRGNGCRRRTVSWKSRKYIVRKNGNMPWQNGSGARRPFVHTPKCCECGVSVSVLFNRSMVDLQLSSGTHGFSGSHCLFTGPWHGGSHVRYVVT